MIIIRLVGGLGNQLFQYAVGRHLAIINKQELKLDTFAYSGNIADPKNGTRVFGLSHFNISAKEATEKDLSIFHNYFRKDLLGKVYKAINRLKIGSYYEKDYIIEPTEFHFRFDPFFLKATLKEDAYLRGYWQSEKYFEGIEDIVRKEFTFKETPDTENLKFIEKIEDTNSVCIHIRHGDNANNVAAQHGVLPLEYYHKAVEEIAHRVENPHFFVFSDDSKWAKENLVLQFPTEYILHNGDEKNYEDMRLMTYCKHHIIGNSTFSWWGAWLGKKDGQIVFAPTDYSTGENVVETDYYPIDWRVI